MEPRLVALKLFLAELGIPETIATVHERKRLQKAVYIGQLSDIDLGYRYGWYLMGPYCPALARDYYDLDEALGEGEQQHEKVELKATVREKLATVKNLFHVPDGVALPQEDWLELLSSVHFLRKMSGYDADTTRDTLKKQKPHLIAYLDKAESALRSGSLL
jgi:uncharacterized protein YwgA